MSSAKRSRMNKISSKLRPEVTSFCKNSSRSSTNHGNRIGNYETSPYLNPTAYSKKV